MNDFKYYSTDPLARFLRDVLHLSPATGALLFAIAASIFGFVSSLINHSLWTRPGQIGFFEDLNGWVWRLIFSPALAGFYIWGVAAIGDLLESLRHSEIVGISNEDLLAAQSYYIKPWRELLAIFGAVILGVIYFLSRSSIQSWASTAFLPKMATTAGMIVGGYMVTILSLTLVTNVLALRKVLKDKEFKLNPLHPDKCGGLKILSDYSLKTAYLAAIAGFLIGLTEYRLITQNLVQQFWYIHALIPVYIIGAFVAFFMPLSQAHSGMKKAKETLMDEIAAQFRIDYAQARISLTKGAENLKGRIGKIEQLQHLYDLTEKFPVWPFNTENLRRFIVATITPLLPIAIGLISQLIEELLLAR